MTSRQLTADHWFMVLALTRNCVTTRRWRYYLYALVGQIRSADQSECDPT